jgi:hypothetical protein
MKTENELNFDILMITLKIEEMFPELSKYIGEMPVKISDNGGPDTDIENLKDYYDSLETLLKNYNTNHVSTTNEIKNYSTKQTIIRITMTKAKNLGIWMDHSSANLMEFTSDPIETKTILSEFTHQDKELGLSKSENLMHNKEQHQQSEYYNKLIEIIRNYEEVVLFGPTDAKVELFNVLREDHRFAKIKIEIKQSDKMTENQQHAFVREHFSKL